MKFLLVLLCGFIAHTSFAGENPPHWVTGFLDSSDLRILLNSRSAIIYELEGEPVEDSMKKNNLKYIHNYAIKSRKIITKEQSTDLKIALLDNHNTSGEMARCSFLADRCIKFVHGNRELILLLSQNGSCGQLVKVIKINSTNKKEAIQSYTSESFKSLYQ